MVPEPRLARHSPSCLSRVASFPSIADALRREARVTPLDLYLLHWRHHLERWWQAHASVVDGLAIFALATLGAALLFD